MNLIRTMRLTIFFWSLLVLLFAGCQASNSGETSPSLIDDVLENEQIRVGYVIYPPGMIKDPNTGELSGIFHDALEAAGENLGLDIVWTEEVGWGTMIEGLQTGRYDLIGSQVWANSSRAKLADFSVPLFFSGIGVYVRSDDERFNESLSVINDPSIRVVTIDGEMSDIIKNAQFPEATAVSLTQMSDVSQALLEVTQGKADVALVEPYLASEFLESNPGTIRNVAADQPVRVFPNTMMFRQGESGFATMLNTALNELINQGYIDQLMDQYAPAEGSFYRVQRPYRLSGE